MKEDALIESFHQTLKANLDRLKERTKEATLSEQVIETLKNMNYMPKGEAKNVNGQSYDAELARQFYLCRYGVAYAFEYAMMYDIVIRSYMRDADTEKMLGAFSFGCGSMIDAWAMIYAKQRLQRENPDYNDCKLYYKGVDVQPWKEYFMESSDLFCNIKRYESDMNQFIDARFLQSKNKMVYHNILMFPKIFNELNAEDIRKMITKLSECHFEYDEYYLCISHSRYDVEYGMEHPQEERGLKVVLDLVDAINSDGKFEVCSDIEEMLGDSFYAEFEKAWLGEDKLVQIPLVIPEELNAYKCYVFDSASRRAGKWKKPKNIADLNCDFQDPEIRAYMTELEQKLDVLEQGKTKNKIRIRQITRVSQIVFQIIRLRKKK